MNAHQFLIETHQGSEEGIYAYGSRDAIRDGLRTAVATLGRPFTFDWVVQGGGFPDYIIAHIGSDARSVSLWLNPPGSYTLDKEMRGVTDSPDATKDWCVSCVTDVRIWPDLPREPYQELYEPALLLRDLTLAGLTCVSHNGTGPGRANIASIPREKVVLIYAPDDWAGANMIVSAWADIVGPTLSVRKVNNLDAYNSICTPDLRIGDAEAKARHLLEIQSLLQEISAAPSASSQTAPST